MNPIKYPNYKKEDVQSVVDELIQRGYPASINEYPIGSDKWYALIEFEDAYYEADELEDTLEHEFNVRVIVVDDCIILTNEEVNSNEPQTI